MSPTTALKDRKSRAQAETFQESPFLTLHLLSLLVVRDETATVLRSQPIQPAGSTFLTTLTSPLALIQWVSRLWPTRFLISRTRSAEIRETWTSLWFLLPLRLNSLNQRQPVEMFKGARGEIRYCHFQSPKGVTSLIVVVGQILTF